MDKVLESLIHKAKRVVRKAYRRHEESDVVLWGDIEKKLKSIISDNELDDVREAIGYPAAKKEVDTRDVYDVLDSLGRSSAAMLQIEALFDSMGLVYESRKKRVSRVENSSPYVRWLDYTVALEKAGADEALIDKVQDTMGRPDFYKNISTGYIFRVLYDESLFSEKELNYIRLAFDNNGWDKTANAFFNTVKN
jgi:hypothetical protein